MPTGKLFSLGRGLMRQPPFGGIFAGYSFANAAW